MKRVWIGVAFLLVLLAVGLVVMQMTDRHLGEISHALTQAAETQTWEQAVKLAKEAKQDWKNKKKLITALTDRNAIDGVEELFTCLEVYQHRKAETEHAVTCAKLAKAIHALEENHRLAWYNLL